VNLPDVFVVGTSSIEDLDDIKPLLSEAIERLIEKREPVFPVQPELYKGKITYRTTPERSYTFAKEAKRRAVFLSRLIDYCVDNLR
jgi:hypothetical protein